jgi:hypothetical protein
MLVGNPEGKRPLEKKNGSCVNTDRRPRDDSRRGLGGKRVWRGAGDLAVGLGETAELLVEGGTVCSVTVLYSRECCLPSQRG